MLNGPEQGEAAYLACCRCGRDDHPWDRIAGKALCASCQELLALGEGLPLREAAQQKRCTVCDRMGTVLFETVPLERTEPIAVYLCGEHLHGLLSRALGAFAFHQLCRRLRQFGVRSSEVFLLHDGFYDADGRALHPT